MMSWNCQSKADSDIRSQTISHPLVGKLYRLYYEYANAIILCDDDNHSEILKRTKKACFKWKGIGRELGFTEEELSSIVQKPGQTGEEDYYSAMLMRWLDWAPPNHYLPSVQRLSSALREVGYEGLALDLDEKFNISGSLECSEEDIYKIAGYDFDWRRVGQRFMCDQKVRDIDCDGRSEGEKRKMMLLEWKRRNSRDATYQALVKELRAIENNATADQVEELERKRKLQGEK
eukprot:Em0007g134a